MTHHHHHQYRLSVTLRHRHSENGIVKTMMTYDKMVSRKPQKLFSMTTALSATSISNRDRITSNTDRPPNTGLSLVALIDELTVIHLHKFATVGRDVSSDVTEVQ